MTDENLPTTRAESIDWNGVDEPMARQILAQAESHLQAQLQCAIASDARAMTVASVLVTLATATAAVAIAYWDKGGSNAVMAGGLTASAFMVVGSILAIWAARPVDFYRPGNQPEKWFPIRRGNLVEALGGEAENQGARIALNEVVLRDSGEALVWGTRLAVAAPLAGFLVWALLAFFTRA